MAFPSGTGAPSRRSRHDAGRRGAVPSGRAFTGGEVRMASEGSRGILPEGEGLRQALRWLDERAREEPGLDRARAIADAARRFDLTPLDEEFLLRSWKRP